MFMQSAKAFTAAEKIAIAAQGLPLRHDVAATGMLAATLVETADGWRSAGRVTPGMAVQTFDGGLCRVVRVDRCRVWPGAGAELVHIPGGVLNNCAALWLMPGQKLMIASPVVEAVLDCAAALVPASLLAGFRGVRLCPMLRAAEMVTLAFDRDEAIFANTGALVHCSAALPLAAKDGFYPTLTAAQVSAMLDLITDDAFSTADLRIAA